MFTDIHGSVLGAGHKMYIKGYNDFTQCNITGDVVQYDWAQDENLLNVRIKHVSCGYYHVLILTEDDKLYGRGSNSDCQLGCKSSFADNTTLFKTLKLLQRGETKNVQLKMVSGGGYFSVLLSETGLLFGCGKDVSETFIKYPGQRFDSPIKFVECGSTSIACISQLGTLYTLGYIGIKQSQYFEKLSEPSRVKHVSVGYNTIGITTETKAYFAGYFRAEAIPELLEINCDGVIQTLVGDDVAMYYNGKELFSGTHPSAVRRDRKNINVTFKHLSCHHTGTI